MILTGSGTIGAAHLPRGFAGVVEPAARALDDRIALEAGMTIDEAEKLLIGITLRHTSGNRTRSAEILGISVKTLFNKLKEYGENE